MTTAKRATTKPSAKLESKLFKTVSRSSSAHHRPSSTSTEAEVSVSVSVTVPSLPISTIASAVDTVATQITSHHPSTSQLPPRSRSRPRARPRPRSRAHPSGTIADRSPFVPRNQYVDLSKLRKTSLKRYKKHFNLDVKADSKTELLEAVARHFAQMPVREADVALEFHNFARSLRGKRSLAADPTALDNGATAAGGASATTPAPAATTAAAGR